MGFHCCIATAKQADLAGSWYTASPENLALEIDRYIQKADVPEPGGKILGFIVPHAGYSYSGPVAGYSYKALSGIDVKNVIIVGFTHRRYFPETAAVFMEDYFETPLGKLMINKDISARLIAYSPSVRDVPEAFQAENSVEIQIPFVQTAAPGARAVLIALSDQKKATSGLLAEALYNALEKEEDYVIIASTDLSHYLSYDTASKKDQGTIDVLKRMDPEELYGYSLETGHDAMCGVGAVYAVMTACRKLGAGELKVLKYANSGDTSLMKEKVVGYLSAAFVNGAQAAGKTEKAGEANMFNNAERSELLKIARDSISYYLKTGNRPEIRLESEKLKQEMGAFVTLHKRGELRGCIGHMTATGPLYLTVRDMAIAAATEDPRFSSMRAEELGEVDLEISVLSPMKKVDSYKDVEVGKHGVMVSSGRFSGVYLPQVAQETGWTREEFLSSLCAHKAGLPDDAWKTGGCEIYVFTAEVFGEKEIER